MSRLETASAQAWLQDWQELARWVLSHDPATPAMMQRVDAYMERAYEAVVSLCVDQLETTVLVEWLMCCCSVVGVKALQHYGPFLALQYSVIGEVHLPFQLKLDRHFEEFHAKLYVRLGWLLVHCQDVFALPISRAYLSCYTFLLSSSAQTNVLRVYQAAVYVRDLFAHVAKQVDPLRLRTIVDGLVWRVQDQGSSSWLVDHPKLVPIAMGFALCGLHPRHPPLLPWCVAVRKHAPLPVGILTGSLLSLESRWFLEPQYHLLVPDAILPALLTFLCEPRIQEKSVVLSVCAQMANTISAVLSETHKTSLLDLVSRKLMQFAMDMRAKFHDGVPAAEEEREPLRLFASCMTVIAAGCIDHFDRQFHSPEPANPPLPVLFSVLQTFLCLEFYTDAYPFAQLTMILEDIGRLLESMDCQLDKFGRWMDSILLTSDPRALSFIWKLLLFPESPYLRVVVRDPFAMQLVLDALDGEELSRRVWIAVCEFYVQPIQHYASMLDYAKQEARWVNDQGFLASRTIVGQRILSMFPSQQLQDRRAVLLAMTGFLAKLYPTELEPGLVQHLATLVLKDFAFALELVYSALWNGMEPVEPLLNVLVPPSLPTEPSISRLQAIRVQLLHPPEGSRKPLLPHDARSLVAQWMLQTAYQKKISTRAEGVQARL